MVAVMASAGVMPLYPQPGPVRSLQGLYLEQDLRAGSGGRMVVYANFVSSLDGRVALPNTRGKSGVPEAIANTRDWWLFQELAVQADSLLVSGRYLRARSRGEVQDLFAAFHDPGFKTLRQWRAARGLPVRPRIVVLTRRVDFAPPLDMKATELLVITGEGAASCSGAQRLRNAGAAVVAAGPGDAVEPRRLRAALTDAGGGLVYAVGGPRVLHQLVAGNVLDRLYLTQVPQLLGGAHMTTLIEGLELRPPGQLRLHSLHLDCETSCKGAGQLFGCFEVIPSDARGPIDYTD